MKHSNAVKVSTTIPKPVSGAFISPHHTHTYKKKKESDIVRELMAGFWYVS